MQVMVPANIGPSVDRLSRYAFVFAFLASLTGLVSIAASHVCLGTALALLLASKTPLRMPPVVLPLAGFMSLTIASMLASDDPLAGWPQLKKFYVFAFLVVLYSLFQSIHQMQRLYQAWFVAAGVAAGLGVAQFVHKWVQLEATGGDFDVEYIDDRITGFFSHWMTFSEVSLLVFVVLLSYLMFSESTRSRIRVSGVSTSFRYTLWVVASRLRNRNVRLRESCEWPPSRPTREFIAVAAFGRQLRASDALRSPTPRQSSNLGIRFLVDAFARPQHLVAT